MRIAILGKYYPPERGGIETHVADLAAALAGRHDVTVIVHNRGGPTVAENSGGVRIVRTATPLNVLSQPISPGTLTALRRVRPDIIHVHAPNIWATLAALRMPPHIPVLVTHHADIVGREPIRSAALVAYRRLVGRASRVIVTARANYEHSTDLPRVPAKIAVVPLMAAAPAETADPRVVVEAYRRRQVMFGAAPLAVFVGRVVGYKGLDVLLDALTRTPDLKAAIVGDGPELDRLQAMATARGLGDRVHFAGHVDERTKAHFLAACDMFVLPSVTAAEAFGIVQVEAMHWSKPVITTRLQSGVPEVGREGETGLLVDPGDPGQLAGAMQHLAAAPAVARRMGAAGRVRARELYSREAFNARVCAIYAAAEPGMRRRDAGLADLAWARAP